MNFDVRFGQLVTQSGIDRESRRDLIRILHIPVRVVAANTARKIANTLQENHRLPGKEAGECVRYREWLEYEEAVARNPLQHVDLLMLESAAELQLMFAVHPAQRSGVIEDIFVSVSRSCDRISNRGIAIHLDEWRSSGNIETRLVLKSKA